MTTFSSQPIHRARLTQAQKDANGKQWYKDEANRLDSGTGGRNFMGFGGVKNFRRKKVNYDLFNNIINLKEFEYVLKPFGADKGELPANNRQNIAQASYIIKPYFELHNTVKGNVLTALLECAKVCYSTGRPRKLSYVLDDMSNKLLTVDQGLLDASTLGLFVANSSKADNAKKVVEGLAQAAMQNQQATLIDIIKVVRSESITEAEELLEVAQEKASEREQAIEKMKSEAQQKAEQRADKLQRDKFTHEKDLLVTKIEMEGEIELQKQAMLSMGFAKDTDADDDGEPDVLEVYKAGTKAKIDQAKLIVDQQKFEHQKKMDEVGVRQTDRKLDIDEKKANKPTGSKK